MNDQQAVYDRIIAPIEDRMIRSIWRIVRNPQDAEDAMQNALLTIWKRLDRVSKHPSPDTLVLKICIDAAYDLTRRRIRDQRTLDLSEVGGEQSDSLQSPLAEMVDTEQHAEIITAIHRLSRRQAIATLMRMVEHQPYRQIATVMGCTEATARKHVARGRDRLRVSLAHISPTNPERGSS
jgi:RNA polymerase sigma factor (sigma-70 family)